MVLCLNIDPFPTNPKLVDDHKLRNSSKRGPTTTTSAPEVVPPPSKDIINSTSSIPRNQSATDEFYDGIPRYKSGSFRKAAKVSEVGSRIGRGAVSVLDTLGSSILVYHHLVKIKLKEELYHEFHALDRFEQDYERDTLGILRSELKSQRKLVKGLRKKSLWSKSMEEVMEKLVEIVHFLYLEMHASFGSAVLSRKPAPQTEVIGIETFHDANREKTEACVLKLVLWLHYSVSQSKPASDDQQVLQN